MKKVGPLLLCVGALVFIALCFSLTGCWNDVNSLPDSHFTENGEIKDKPDSVINMVQPGKVKMFMEVSGSMNGLYRTGCRSEFRDDVYQIVSYYVSNSDRVYTLSRDNGKSGDSYSLSEFTSAIRDQGFTSMNTTSIPDMISTVISTIDTTTNEVGVLVSDMKYDPDGTTPQAIAVSLGMYTSQISHLTSSSNLAFSLVAATSKYYGADGTVVAEESPYYYLIVGKPENVAKVRDDISSMLYNNGNYVENVETGMNYGAPMYELEAVQNCSKMDDKNPTFVDVDDSDPCKIKIKLHLENYRWAMANEDVIRESFACKMLHGATVNVDSVSIDSSFVDSSKNLKRSMIASIYLSVKDMVTECDVIEWSFNPCSQDGKPCDLEPFYGAATWQDFTKTYSIENFIEGFYRGAHLSTYSKKSNYILISTNS